MQNAGFDGGTVAYEDFDAALNGAINRLGDRC